MKPLSGSIQRKIMYTFHYILELGPILVPFPIKKSYFFLMLKTKLYKKKVQILEKSSFWPLTVEFITELEKMAHFQVALNDLYIQV